VTTLDAGAARYVKDDGWLVPHPLSAAAIERWVSATMASPPASFPDTPERIIQAARRLFGERGVGGTTMSAIAAEAGVVRATVYNNFSDKTEILSTLVRRYMKGYVAIRVQLRPGYAASGTNFEQLEAMTRMALAWRIANSDLREAIDIARHTQGIGWEEADAEADDAMLGWLVEMHQLGERRGLTHPELDLSIATPAVYSMIESALSNFDVRSPASSADLLAHQLTLIHWHAIYRYPPE
jgi:AcrR family transcriptional regulator